jgi:hypothetical protein
VIARVLDWFGFGSLFICAGSFLFPRWLSPPAQALLKSTDGPNASQQSQCIPMLFLNQSSASAMIRTSDQRVMRGVAYDTQRRMFLRGGPGRGDR